MKTLVGTFFACFLFWLFFVALIQTYANPANKPDNADRTMIFILTICSTLAIWGLFL